MADTQVRCSVTEANMEERMAALMNMRAGMEAGEDKDLKDYKAQIKAEKVKQEQEDPGDMMAQIKAKQERLRKEHAKEKAEKKAKKKAYEERKAARKAAAAAAQS